MKRLLLCTFTLALMLFALASCFGENHVYSGPCDPSCNECDRVTREPEVDHTFADCSDTECDVCGEVREAVYHTYKSACSAKCEACGYAREDAAAHIYDSPCDAECNVCGEAREASEHIYANNCDTDCNFCGALRVTNHTYTNACDKTCNVCGATRIPEAHTYSNACDSTCDVCGELRMVPNHVYSTVCDADCNVCGELRIASAHVYDHACDGDCNVCGATRVVADHVYDNACDAECNTCQTVRSNIHDFGDWRIKSAADCDNAAVEVKYCALCGEEVTREGEAALGHVFENECDTECNRAKCGYRRTIEHTYEDEFATKLAATCTSVEILHRFCAICGAEDTKIGAPATGHAFENVCDEECINPGCDFVRVITEHDHSFSEWATQSPATCTEAEIEFRVCGDCGDFDYRVGDPALDHDFDNACDTECNRQGCGYTREITHAYEDWTTLTPATCTEYEVEEQICSICFEHNPETRLGDAPLDHAYTNECDAICDRDCGFERTPPHVYTDEHDVTCDNGCGHVRPCNGHKALSTDCTVCEYCGEAIPDSTHSYIYVCDTNCSVCNSVITGVPHAASAANCTICQYCDKPIEGAAHVATAEDCTICKNCDAGTGVSHVADPTNCTHCANCDQASGIDHVPATNNCTTCGVCEKLLGTAHKDADDDHKCDDCGQETLPGENWFPWAPL